MTPVRGLYRVGGVFRMSYASRKPRKLLRWRLPPVTEVTRVLSRRARSLHRLVADLSVRDGWCVARQSYLARRLRCEERTIRRCVKELAAAGLLIVIREGRQLPNRMKPVAGRSIAANGLPSDPTEIRNATRESRGSVPSPRQSNRRTPVRSPRRPLQGNEPFGPNPSGTSSTEQQQAEHADPTCLSAAAADKVETTSTRTESAAKGLYEMLLARGLWPARARELVATVPAEEIRRQLRAAPYRRAYRYATNRGALLATAIVQRWEEPEAVQAEVRRAHRRSLADAARQDERRARDDAAAQEAEMRGRWASLTPAVQAEIQTRVRAELERRWCAQGTRMLPFVANKLVMLECLRRASESSTREGPASGPSRADRDSSYGQVRLSTGGL